MKITKRSIDALAPLSREVFHWDGELKGFGVRVSPRGKKTFVVQYRASGRTRRMSLGTYGVLTPDQARNMAIQSLADVAQGNDPSGERGSQRRAPTVAALCDRFLEEHVEVRCKPSTLREYRRCCELYIKPAIGTYRIQDVARPDINTLHHAGRDAPYQANRVLAALSKMFNLAELWGLRQDGTNPTRHVKKYPEIKRQRFLSPEEIGMLWTTLDKCEADGTETPHVVAAFKLLLLTGCRLSEIQKLRWSYVRDDVIFLPDAKTGPRRVLLSLEALHVLSHVQTFGKEDFVILGSTRENHVTDLQKPWRRIRTSAKLTDVRIHDLRHTYASIAAMAGHSLPMIGRLLGHTQAQTTARYAHLADNSARKALNEVDEMISSFTEVEEVHVRDIRDPLVHVTSEEAPPYDQRH